MADLNIPFRGVVPLAQYDSQGAEFTQEFYAAITQRKLPVYQIVEKPRGRGKQRICEVVGSANAFLKHRVLRVAGELTKEVYSKPYLRLLYSYKEGTNDIDLDSIGLILSEESGHLTEFNYEIERK